MVHSTSRGSFWYIAVAKRGLFRESAASLHDHPKIPTDALSTGRSASILTQKGLIPWTDSGGQCLERQTSRHIYGMHPAVWFR